MSVKQPKGDKMERITVIDLAEAIGNLLNLINKMELKENITGEQARRARQSLSIISKVASNAPTDGLRACDL